MFSKIFLIFSLFFINFSENFDTKNISPFHNSHYQKTLEYAKNDDFIFRCHWGNFLAIPQKFQKFSKNPEHFCTQPTSAYIVNAYLILQNSENSLLQNTDEIDENSKFSLIFRTNFGENFNNSNDENPYKNFEKFHFDYLDKNFYESWIFIGEEISGKCAKYFCEISSEDFPFVIRNFLKNPENIQEFIQDYNLENLIFTDEKLQIFFKKSQKISENFAFFIEKNH